MTKQDIIRKLTSRKFILTFALLIFGVLCVTGVIPQATQEQWKYIFMMSAGVIAYIFSEGVTDIFGIIAQNKNDSLEYEEYEEGEEE